MKSGSASGHEAGPERNGPARRGPRAAATRVWGPGPELKAGEPCPGARVLYISQPAECKLSAGSDRVRFSNLIKPEVELEAAAAVATRKAARFGFLCLRWPLRGPS
jgi:hypothetical protein